ncbi:MAG: CCA tRNA nucleotidyltransferase [Oscillatoriales cyanobacterium SM2_2_1]|nr:CCA tRNA nucleotidyltransferase [Oscillatoriales cyanobacterium SM2_2_1]
MDLLPFDLSELPRPVYLVGGWVRDRLLQRPLSRRHDFDWVLPINAMATAQAIARRHRAGFVVLDPERQIARLVFSTTTVDMATQMGDSLAADLARRDFCMNAIALVFPENSAVPHTFDPHNGQSDLRQQCIRMVHPDNLIDDPLRLLRAYRQAAQLNFTLDPATHAHLRNHGLKLGAIAADRVRAELFALLTAPLGPQWLLAAIGDGVLEAWLPTPALNGHRLRQMTGAIAQIEHYAPALKHYFDQLLTSDRPARWILHLTALVHHATTLDPLALSRTEQRWVMTLLRHFPQLQSALISPTIRAQYELFTIVGELTPALITLALADGCPWTQLQPWLDIWCDPANPIAHPPTLVTGHDLKAALNLKNSPKIGALLSAIRLAQAEGLVTDTASAIAYAQSQYNTNDP